MANVIEYVKDSYTELVERVTWPGPKQLQEASVLVFHRFPSHRGHCVRDGLGVRGELSGQHLARCHRLIYTYVI